ncbi:helicase, partial [Staphylococcus pseudintermedius]|nr:helicase [Staphylococcus pseudintermedius]
KNSKILARKIEVIENNAGIKQKEIKAELDRKVAESHNNLAIIEDLQEKYEKQRKKIEKDLKSELTKVVNDVSKEMIDKSTESILKLAENKKKEKVEDDVRARLRGFARTIPSFLMAYGNSSTSLKTFDDNINENVFKEVTGITIEQFRTLRDSYNFFDGVIFDESISEFMNKRKELANYFNENQEEDIFDYIPPQKTNQIYTPKKVVKLMVDRLKAENPEDFCNPHKTFADLYMKSGLYITEIVKRLYIGLEKEIPNPDERLKHILENQVYGFAPTEIIYNIARNYVFGFDEKAIKISDSNFVCLDTTPYARGEGDFQQKCEELFGGKTNEI